MGEVDKGYIMSRRRIIAQKIDRYGDVRTMLVAMKNLALMEINKLGAQIERQNKLLETVARVADDFSSFYPLPVMTGATICIAIGTERGFCGEFNTELVAPLRAGQERGERILIVGRHLAERMMEEGAFETMSGATVAEEVPMILEHLAIWLEQTQAQSPDLPMNVKVLYQDENAGRPVFRTILPLPVSQNARKDYSHKPCLTLEPPAFLTALGEQALMLSLEGYSMLSLAAENRRRLEHMESALHRLEDRTTDLKRRMNAARQEDIIQEIETIMLGSSEFK